MSSKQHTNTNTFNCSVRYVLKFYIIFEDKLRYDGYSNIFKVRKVALVDIFFCSASTILLDSGCRSI